MSESLKSFKPVWLGTLFLGYDAASLGNRIPIFRRYYISSKRREVIAR